MWLLLACRPSSSDLPPLLGSPPAVAADSGTADPTGSTGSTGDTAVPLPPVPPDCDDLPVVGPPSTAPEIDSDPLPFDPRADGLTWFGSYNGVLQGVNPGGSMVVWPAERVDAVREAPNGTLWFADGTLWRVLAGGVPEPIVEEIGTTDDIEAHPSGAVILAGWSILGGERTVVYVDPAGVPEVHEAAGLPVQAVAWGNEGNLWILANGLWTVPAFADGRPDWSVPATQLLTQDELFPPSGFYGPQGGDLAVDACGGVTISAFTQPFGHVHRYDPYSASLTRLPGTLDQGYGGSPLRFGKVPGSETWLRTSSGGWAAIRRSWVTWDLGVGAL